MTQADKGMSIAAATARRNFMANDPYSVACVIRLSNDKAKPFDVTTDLTGFATFDA
jgi:hypothetical protein